MRDSKKRELLAHLAEEIQAEMERLGLWLSSPPSEETVLAGGAFGQGAVSFETWLQVVFVRRLRQASAGEFPLPKESSVGVIAAREWDGQERSDLLRLIGRVDQLFRT